MVFTGDKKGEVRQILAKHQLSKKSHNSRNPEVEGNKVNSMRKENIKNEYVVSILTSDMENDFAFLEIKHTLMRNSYRTI